MKPDCAKCKMPMMGLCKDCKAWWKKNSKDSTEGVINVSDN